MLQKKQIVVHDVLVNYYISSVKKAPKTLLFLHGWRSNSKVWFPLLKRLQRDFTLYSLDLPGFGDSEIPEKPWTHADYVTVVSEFVTRLNMKNVAVVGHSFGGSVAMRLAIQLPKLVRLLVLVDSSGIRKKTAVKTTKNVIAKIAKPVFQIPFMKKPREAIYRMLGAEDYVVTPYLKDTFRNIIQEDLTMYLAQIKQKTLLIWGKDDIDSPLHHAHLMERMIPNASLVIVPNAGHFSFTDQPEQFTDVLLTFLQKNE